MNKRSLILPLTAVVVLLTALVAGLIFASVQVNSRGTIATVNVRADKTAIDWGLVYSGQNYTTTVTVFNDGTVNMTLSLSHNAPSYILTGWNREGFLLSPHSNTTATIWLMPQPTNETEFSFNYIITGTNP